MSRLEPLPMPKVPPSPDRIGSGREDGQLRAIEAMLELHHARQQQVLEALLARHHGELYESVGHHHREHSLKLYETLYQHQKHLTPSLDYSVVPSLSTAPPLVIEYCEEPAKPSDSNEAVGECQPTPLHLRAQDKYSEAMPMPARVRRFVLSTPFELAMLLVIIANTFVMFVRVQLRGEHSAYKLGVRNSDEWTDHEARFTAIEALFNAAYLVELMLQLFAHGKQYPKYLPRLLDCFVVLSGCMDSFVLGPLQIKTVNLSVLRLVRLTRVGRLLKFLRSSDFFSEMRVIIQALRSAIIGIFWSMVILAILIMGGGILMAQLSLTYMDDDSFDLETRIWIYQSFGTTTRAAYTMFECTFTSAWTQYSRRLIDEVSYIFALFWVLWIVLVNFLTMRVIAALFLKRTMSVSAADEEKSAMYNLKNREEFAGKIRAIFSSADSSGDGAISFDEFERMLLDQDVVKDFAELGLDVDEVTALFNVMSADDGTADYEEFLYGALKMNSCTRTLDSVQVEHLQMRMKDDIARCLMYLEQHFDTHPTDNGPPMKRRVSLSYAGRNSQLTAANESVIPE